MNYFIGRIGCGVGVIDFTFPIAMYNLKKKKINFRKMEKLCGNEKLVAEDLQRSKSPYLSLAHSKLINEI